MSATIFAVAQTTITASLDGVSGATTLTVTSVTLVGIIVNNSATSSAPPATLPVVMGQHTRLQFYAWGNYSDGSTRRIFVPTWTSSKPNIASVNINGRVLSKKKTGTATVSANYGGVTESVQVSVTLASLQSVAISPTTASIAPGTTQQFTLTGTHSDGSKQDLTALAYWQAQPFGVATIAKERIGNGVGDRDRYDQRQACRPSRLRSP